MLRELGRPDEAAAELRRAHEIYERKGHRSGLARTAALLEELSAQR